MPTCSGGSGNSAATRPASTPSCAPTCRHRSSFDPRNPAASLILNLPGSPTGAVESLEAVLDLIPHALNLLDGKTDIPRRRFRHYAIGLTELPTGSRATMIVPLPSLGAPI